MADPSIASQASELESDPFYVGYLPLPATHRRFLKFALPLILWIFVFLGFAIVWPQRSPGSGVWETVQPIERTGLLIASPYPLLVTGSNLDTAKVTILTEMGKHGALDRATPYDGVLVTIRGYRLHRDGREILELAPESDAITPLPDQSPAPALAAAARARLIPPRPASAAPVSIRGEILDSKCYLGAMKPGDGKTHKACAMLCIRGGIAPMLYASQGETPHTYSMVLNSSGGPIDQSTLDLVGEPVHVLGIPGRLGDLELIFVIQEPGRAR